MRFRRIVFVIAATFAAALHAQPVADGAGAQKREAQRAASRTFLDRTKPEKERIAAAPQIGWPDEKTFAALLAAGADRRESDAIRWEALHKHRFDDKWLNLVLKILDDPADGGEFLDWKLIEHLNRRATFKLPAEIRQRIQATWRKLLDDPRGQVRLGAYRVAVANHDPVAVNRLSEALRKRTRAPIPLDEAVDLLDLEGSINHLGALRPYLRHNDVKVRARAVRALAADTESRPYIVEQATSKGAPREVRLNALRALAREDARFGSYAIPLLENAGEELEIRYAAMHEYAGRMNYSRTEAAEQIRFAVAVEKLAADKGLKGDAAGKIQGEARELHNRLKTAFPEIRKHYEGR